MQRSTAKLLAAMVSTFLIVSSLSSVWQTGMTISRLDSVERMWEVLSHPIIWAPAFLAIVAAAVLICVARVIPLEPSGVTTGWLIDGTRLLGLFLVATNGPHVVFLTLNAALVEQPGPVLPIIIGELIKLLFGVLFCLRAKWLASKLTG